MKAQQVSEQSALQTVRKRSRSWIGAIVLTLLVVILLVGAYAVTLGPEHYAQSQAERVSGSETIDIGTPAVEPKSEQTVATVTPAAEWSVRPIVTPLIGELQVLKNPAVVFGFSPGVQLDAPDGMLKVKLEPLGEIDPAAVFAAEGAPGAPVQEERLSTGLVMKHVDTGSTPDESPHGIIAIIGPAEDEGAATSLLVRVTRDDNAKFDLNDYRPALSELFETIEFAG